MSLLFLSLIAWFEIGCFDAKFIQEKKKIILDNEEDFYGNLDCTLASEVLDCTVEDDESHTLTFSR